MSDLPNSFDASDWELSDDFYTENAEQKRTSPGGFYDSGGRTLFFSNRF